MYKKIFDWTKENDPSMASDVPGTSNGEPITLYSKLTAFFKRSNIIPGFKSWDFLLRILDKILYKIVKDLNAIVKKNPL